MLHDFLQMNRAVLIDRCKVKAARRSAPSTLDDTELQNGMSLLLDHLIEVLRADDTREPSWSARFSGGAQNAAAVLPASDQASARHGVELSRHGYPVEEVVYGYGDLCQAITDLALERNAPIHTHEFRTLNYCLDNAIADALRAFCARGAQPAAGQTARASQERLGFLAHELRNCLHTATIALAVIRAGDVGSGGATAAILDRSMSAMRALIDRSLAEVRTDADLPPRPQLIVLTDFIARVRLSASLEARDRACTLTVSPVDPALAVHADPDLLFSAVSNLLQNGFKFTGRGREVRLEARALADRILIDVADGCGGLPAEDLERIFLPFVQTGADKSGIGLGLSICRRNVEANGGALRVRNAPGSGCVFTIDLPRHVIAKQCA